MQITLFVSVCSQIFYNGRYPAAGRLAEDPAERSGDEQSASDVRGHDAAAGAGVHDSPAEPGQTGGGTARVHGGPSRAQDRSQPQDRVVQERSQPDHRFVIA